MGLVLMRVYSISVYFCLIGCASYFKLLFKDVCNGMPSLEDMRGDHDLKLTKDLDVNIRKIQNEFDDDETLKTRVIESQRNPGIRCCIFLPIA